MPGQQPAGLAKPQRQGKLCTPKIPYLCGIEHGVFELYSYLGSAIYSVEEGVGGHGEWLWLRKKERKEFEWKRV